MKKLPVVLLVFLLGMVFSTRLMAGNQYIIPLADGIYEEMDSLYALNGLATPSTSRPWSLQEARLILERVPAQSGKQAVQKLRSSIEHQLDAIKPNIQLDADSGLGLHLILSPEIYTHTNTTEYDLESDWEYGYAERQSFAKFSIEMDIHNFFYTYCDLEYQRDRFSAEDVYTDGGTGGLFTFGKNSDGKVVDHSFGFSPEFSTNYFSLQYVDFETPYRAFVSFGGQGWNLQAGRDLLSWGNGNSGNLMIGDHRDFYDVIRFTAFSDKLKYEYLTAFFDPPSFTSGGEIPSTEVKALIAHRLEFRPFDWLSFAVSENVMYQHDFYDIRFFNPAYILHNLNNRSMFNALAYAEADIQLFPGISVYGQFALDQARAPLEDGSQPNTFGYIGGLEYTLAEGPGILSGYTEFAKTDPYLYYRDEVDFKVMRRQFIIGGSITSYTDFLGYKYGGDALVLESALTYRIPEQGSLQGELFLMRHGEVTIQTEPQSGQPRYPNADQKTPSGDTVFDRMRVSFAGEYEVPQLSWLKTWARVDYLVRRTFTKSTEVYSDPEEDTQFSCGFSITL